jgi:hypothetical protein
MKKIISILVLVVVYSSVLSQDNINQGSVQAPNKPGDSVFEKVYVPKNAGSKMLFDADYSAIVFFGDKPEKKDLNIDLEENIILYTTNGRLMQLDYIDVDSISFDNFKIIFTLGDLQGCMLVYNMGPHNLINRKTASLKESDHNKALDVGEKDNKWIVKDEFYLEKFSVAHYEKDYGIFKLPSKKKKVSELFVNSDEALSYIKSEKLKLDEAEDLVKLFDKFGDDLK